MSSNAFSVAYNDILFAEIWNTLKEFTHVNISKNKYKSLNVKLIL